MLCNGPISRGKHLNTKVLTASLLTGLAYYAGAWAGVNLTINPEGIAVLWPANAIALAALLRLPWRYWPGIATAVMAAEVIADLPAFPLWAALAFGLINLFEITLAACLIRRVVNGPFNFDCLRNGGIFLLFGPLVSSALAGMMGAVVYILLARADTPFITLWQLWWFGDALGLLLLTPLIVTAWACLEGGFPSLKPVVLAEAGLLWLTVVVVGLYAFAPGEPGQLAYFIKPAWLAPLAIIAALRQGLPGATATLSLITAITLGHLINGIHPYGPMGPQYTVWLTQEYLAIMALVTFGLALLMREIGDHRQALRANQRALQASKTRLEERVQERTLELQQANEALAAANHKLEITAATDELTGLSNRRHFHARAARELERLRSAGGSASVIMIDLDHFKEINDHFGHEAGDSVLRSLQEPLVQSLRPRDLTGRIGGEEFVIMLSGKSLDTALAVAQRVRLAIEDAVFVYRDRRIPVTASLGVAQWDGRSGLDALINSADEVLYRAKQQGRNQVVWKAPDL